jgi:hypothetical protein
MDIEKEELVGVMASAYHLKYRTLMEGCVASMLKTITTRSVCAYHEAALKVRCNEMSISLVVPIKAMSNIFRASAAISHFSQTQSWLSNSSIKLALITIEKDLKYTLTTFSTHRASPVL